MSTTDFKKFMSSIQTDAGVRGALTDRLGEGGRIPAESLISLARDHGYSFTVEEAEGQLSDAALEGVTGGAGTTFLKLGDIKGESMKYVPKVEYRADLSAFTFSVFKF